MLNIIYSFVSLSLILPFPTTNNKNHSEKLGCPWSIFLVFYLLEGKMTKLVMLSHDRPLYSKTPPCGQLELGSKLRTKLSHHTMMSQLLPFTFINGVLSS